ncbi:MAG: 2-succinyl-6-hydroxy-2,4-cyclohexadiene-1-carboxylate synthase [Steroidobacteraceae bacterium]
MTAGALHFERRGKGSPLMLLHGFTGSANSMRGLADGLARDFETIAPDLPGHGRSTAGADAGYSFDACLDALVATLHAAGHRRAHWLGYSMGARLALAVAVRHPDSVASLVLLSGRAGIASEGEREARRRADETLARRIETEGVAAFVDEWMAMPMFQTQQLLGAAFLEEQRRERLRNDAAGLAASLRALGPAAQPPLFDELSRVTVPALLVVGALDTAFVAHGHELERRLSGAQLCEIADAGHAVHLERPSAVVAAVHDFLCRAAGPARSSHPPSVQETGS